MPVYSLSNQALSIKVNSFGAELCSVIANETKIEYIWQANETVWPRHAPNLFPTVGKLNNGKFSFNHSEYELPQHGFARDNEFICVEETSTKIVFELTANETLLKSFPFHFSLQIIYTLKNNSLLTEYVVFNPDNSELYFSLGAHPAFNCPLLPLEVFSDYELQFKNLNHLTVTKLHNGAISQETETMKLINSTLPLSHTLFETDALVLKNNQINSVKLISKKSGNGVEMLCRHWPYFGIWTKSNTSEFVCLEPWYGIADSLDATGNLEEKEGIVKLYPESYFKCEFELNFF